jgi:hypothetical protein
MKINRSRLIRVARGRWAKTTRRTARRTAVAISARGSECGGAYVRMHERFVDVAQ